MLFLLPGCAEGGQTTSPTDNQPEPATGGNPTQGTENATTEVEWVSSQLPISFDGKVNNYAGLCEMSTVGTCVGTPTGTSASMWTQQIDGRPHAFAVEMSWDAASPATATLGMTALACWEADNSTTCGKLDGLEGTSPLVLDVPETGLPDGATLFIGAYLPNALPSSPVPGLAVFYRLEQAFHFEGNVSVLVPA